MPNHFEELLTTRFAIAKSQHPGIGRRKLRLRVLQEFWDSNPSPPTEHTNTETPSDEVSTQAEDPLDHITDNRGLGLVLRTDYSNEEAWQSFCAKLQTAEKDLADALKEDRRPAAGPPESSTEARAEPESDSEDDQGVPSLIVKIVNPSLPEEITILNGISNLTALRLFNEVGIRPAPALPLGAGRVNPPHRLIDQAQWQEVYSGVDIWIYDALSNTDQAVRLVSQEGDFYGTATGDSWRVRVTHIPELQFNKACLGMKIDFGGLDRWDFVERSRNIAEANVANA